MSLVTVHQNPWFSVTLREQEGVPWYRVQRPDSAMTIARVADGRLIMVYGSRDTVGPERYWEFPAGAIDAGEEPAQAAVREAREETGHTVESVAELGSFVEMAGMSTARCHAFTGVSVAVNAQELEEGEEWSVRLVTDTELDDLVATGQVIDAGTLASYALLRARR